jgi:hypothetical protein
LKLFNYTELVGPDYEALVATECGECFIRVSGFRSELKDKDRVDTEVFINMFSSHNDVRMVGWRWRVTRIWRIVRGRPDPDYEIFSGEVLQNFITALTECHVEIFKPKLDGKESIYTELASQYDELPTDNNSSGGLSGQVNPI